MYRLIFSFPGWEQFANMLDASANMLELQLSQPLLRTRDAIWHGINEMFDTEAQLGPKPWAGWSRSTKTQRDAKHPSTYYGRRAMVADDKIGQWVGEIKRSLTSETAPGFSTIRNDTLHIGITRTSDRKYDVFITGRLYKYQPERAVYENLALEDIVLAAFTAWAKEQVPVFQIATWTA